MVGSRLQQEIRADSPTAYYQLDDGSGSTAVDVIAALNATLTNSPTWDNQGGIPCLKFVRASSQYAVTAATSTLALNTALTAECLYMPTATAIAQARCHIINKGGAGGYEWALNTATAGVGKFAANHWETGGGSVAAGLSNSAIFTTPNVWYHIAATWPSGADAAYPTMYVNGVVVASTGSFTSDTGQSSGGAFYIGARGDGSDYCDGWIAHVAVYRGQALSAQRIAQHGWAFLNRGVVGG